MKLFKTITPEVSALIQFADASNKPIPPLVYLHQSHRFKLEGRTYAAGQEFAAACSLWPASSDFLNRASDLLPDLVFSCLVLSLGCRMKAEEVEKLLDIPFRSAKLLVWMGLIHLLDAGVVKP